MTNNIVVINDDKIELKKVTIDLIEEMGGEIPSQIIRSSNLIIDYHWHKETKNLTDAIKNESWVLETELMRKFVALIVGGKYKSLKKGFIKKTTVKKHHKAFARFAYYRAMGLPIDDKSTFSCVALASKDSHISEFTLINEILNNRKADDIFSFWTPVIDGKCIETLNAGKPPINLKTLIELEKRKSELSQDEEHEIYEYYLESTVRGTENFKDHDKESIGLINKIEKKYSIR